MTSKAAFTQLVKKRMDKFSVPIKVHVLDSVLDARLPASLAPGSGFIAKGVTHKGEIYLFCDARLEGGDVFCTLFHNCVTLAIRHMRSQIR